MRTCIVIGYDAKGKSRVLAGPEQRIEDNLKLYAKLKSDGLPKDVAKIEKWESDAGITGTAFPKPTTTEK